MKKKHFINPDAVKLISSITITIFVTIVCFFLTNSIMKQLLTNTKTSYIQLLNTSLNAYSQIIKSNLENYQTHLEYIFDEDFFTNATPDEIGSFLEKRNFKSHQDFNDIFFIDNDFDVHCSSGLNFSLLDFPELYEDYNLDKGKFYISNGFDFRKDGYSFLIGKPVYGENGKLKGNLGASISLSKLDSIIKQSNSIQEDSIILQDETGRFLVHPDKNWILKDYIPSVKQAEGITSKYVSSISSGEIKTADVQNNPIYLTFKKIDGTKWTIAIRTPQNKLENLQKKQSTYKLYIIFIVLLTIVILVSIENIIIRTFQRKELMVTTYDPLTNVWTRQKFESEAKKLLKKHPFTKFMMVETDIRGFKFINQNFGEEEADKIIKFIAKLLTKESVYYHSIMGRGFADHFYTFVRISSVRNAMNEFKAFNTRLNEAVKQYDIPFQLKFGISFLLSGKKNKDVSIQTLIGQASFAKSIIKDDMVTDYSIYNSRLIKKINEERFLENNMEKALQNHEFFVLYQPKISLETEKIVGAEALVRWRNPELGLLAPNTFIELFEKNGFIKKLDFYVYEEVFKLLKKMQDENQSVVPVSINMSRSHSKPDKFMHDFMKIFKKYSIDPKLIEVEILERSVMDNNTLKIITDLLHKEGFTVAMDDFGSGESSLNMLTKIPVDVLKFDRTFLISATDENGNMDESSMNIISTLIDLGKSLNKKTIFEGVETETQRNFLKNTNCDQIQGFLYSKPLSEEEFVEFIKTHS